MGVLHTENLHNAMFAFALLTSLWKWPKSKSKVSSLKSQRFGLWQAIKSKWATQYQAFKTFLRESTDILGNHYCLFELVSVMGKN